MPIQVPGSTAGPSIRFPHGESVVVVTPATTTNPYSGEPADSWDDADVTLVEVPGVAVEPRPSGEPLQDARNQVTSGFTLYFPTDVEVTARDRVIVRGVMHNVLGEPAAWVNPFTGWAPGVVVQTERTEG